jgi:hypothetical protein
MSRESIKTIKLHDNTLRQRLIWYVALETLISREIPRLLMKQRGIGSMASGANGTRNRLLNTTGMHFVGGLTFRLGEKGGNKIVGNSWIWKEKYD